MGLRTYVILLRAIGPATHRLMSMAAWREAAETAGFTAPKTHVNTGNMLAEYDGPARAGEAAMTAVLRSFGLGENVIPVLREPQVFEKLSAAIASDVATPAQTGVYFFVAKKPDFSWLASHDGPERLRVVNEHLLVDFTRDVAKSGRLIRQIDKFCGVSTARNWNTVRGLAEICLARGKSS